MTIVCCGDINSAFRKKLTQLHNKGTQNSPNGTETIDMLWKTSMEYITNLKKGVLSRTVQTRFFWLLPGLIATHAEEQSNIWIHSCISSLYMIKRSIMNRTHVPQIVRRSQNNGNNATPIQKTLALRRERAIKLNAAAVKPVTPDQVKNSHEECFLVYDDFQDKLP